MTVVSPPVQDFDDLAAWLCRQIENLDADYNDDETRASIGIEAVRRSQARVSAYRDVLHQIAPAILMETADQRQAARDDGVESRWRDAYGDEPLAAWQAEGR